MVLMAKLVQYKSVLVIVATIAFAGLMAGTMPQIAGAATSPTDFGVADLDTQFEGTLGDQPLAETVAGIINVALSLLGIVAVVIILIGGFKWMTAGGSDEKVGEARKLIFSGIIGLAIILSAWAIARFVLESISNATDSGKIT